MDQILKKDHWEKVFKEKKLNEVSWYQAKPQTSLDLIHLSGLSKNASIIDVGCGDSLLIDSLIEEGYTNLYALDISSAALERAIARLGNKADLVHWIVADVTKFQPGIQFDFWHDRAAFHFLTEKKDVDSYVSIVNRAVQGYMSIGTFSETGPLKCSGLEIKQYTEKELETTFDSSFEKLKCFQEKHTTPSQSIQNFTFCFFKKRK